eukprot:1853840-Rhodomonas_salina.1
MLKPGFAAAARRPARGACCMPASSGSASSCSSTERGRSSSGVASSMAVRSKSKPAAEVEREGEGATGRLLPDSAAFLSSARRSDSELDRSRAATMEAGELYILRVENVKSVFFEVKEQSCSKPGPKLPVPAKRDRCWQRSACEAIETICVVENPVHEGTQRRSAVHDNASAAHIVLRLHAGMAGSGSR